MYYNIARGVSAASETGARRPCRQGATERAASQVRSLFLVTTPRQIWPSGSGPRLPLIFTLTDSQLVFSDSVYGIGIMRRMMKLIGVGCWVLVVLEGQKALIIRIGVGELRLNTQG
ncbi:predicted protein [Plenodomus lingam JN3]|uniref:Uncharacterized protein n=1 Tax=Leptosphaeria maculans (strain JN3 / isolate v23.1.3 / race Av1-4-5-6-7-8) TaxID=985895 RepID=M1ZIJ9_LEPMJ|nr:predicted protein [Plenodomus lingam JN3]